MTNGDKPLANPFVVLREEFDNWAILFDLDRGHGLGLSSTWGPTSTEESVTRLRAPCR